MLHVEEQAQARVEPEHGPIEYGHDYMSEPAEVPNQRAKWSGGRNHAVPGGGEVIGLQVVIAPGEAVLGDDVRGEGHVGEDAINRLVCSDTAAQAHAQFIDLFPDSRLKLRNAPSTEERVHGSTPHLMVLVGEGEEGRIRSHGRIIEPGIFIARLSRTGVDFVIEIWIADMELVRIDAHDGACAKRVHH